MPPSCNIPGANKGKKPIASEGKDADGFVHVKTRNWNRGQKRNLMERQEEDTFNRFEILDELGQQEVNPRLINVDQNAGILVWRLSLPLLMLLLMWSLPYPGSWKDRKRFK